MPSTMLGAQEIFEDPAFGLQLTEWQRNNMNLADRQGAFCDGVENDFGGPDRERRQPEDTGEYICELTVEEFDDPANIWRDMVSTETMALHDLRATANSALTQAKDELITIGEEAGASQFVLWGLRRFLQSHASDLSIGALRGKIKTAEDRFLVVDNLVRDNAGEVLTIMNHPMGFIAGKLGVGGITIKDRSVIFPAEEGSSAYFTSLLNDSPTIYDDPSFGISADFAAAADPVILSPGELLKPRSWWYNRTSLYVGGVVYGPLYVEGTKGIDNDTHIAASVDKVRAITILAGGVTADV